MTDPLDKPVWIGYGENGKTLFEKQGHVIGVTADFHVQNLRVDIQPVFITIEPNYAQTGQAGQMQFVYVKLAPGQIRASLAAVEQTWQQHFPTRPFEATFLNERLRNVYDTEAQFGQTVGFFASLAVLVACLGLFGLSAYTIELRIKEIGVRKVMGASVMQVVALLNREFSVLVGLGFLIGAPVAWYCMRQWLTDFPYRIDITAALLVGSGALTFLLAWLTVSYQSIRAARMNPVRSLRHE